MSSLKLSTRLIIIAIIPLVIIFYYNYISFYNKYHLYKESVFTEKLNKISVNMSSLIHEVQKERGASSLFIGSKGTEFSSELNAQRKITDEKIALIKQNIESEHTIKNNDILKVSLENILNNLSRISDIREKVNKINDPAEVISFYTITITSIMNFMHSASNITTDYTYKNKLISYISLAQAKETAGQERAVLSNVFAANKFNEGMYERFISITSKQDVYFNQFTSYAENKFNDLLNSKVINSDILREIKTIREKAIQNKDIGDFNISAPQWFQKATVFINSLKDVEDELSMDMHSYNSEKLSKAKKGMIFSLITTFSLLTIVLASTIYTARKIFAQVGGEPIQAIEITNLLSKGDFTVDFSSNHENSVLSKLKDMIQALTLLIVRINDNYEQVKSTIYQLDKAANATMEKTTEQADLSSQVATASEEMSSTIAEIAMNTTTLTKISDEINEKVDSGSKIANETISVIQEAYTATNTLSSMISQLNQSAIEIEEIVVVIEDIADQTNLIALNAAIEAARAGEAGRGFAVVADEVRKLAEKTIKATKEISGRIDAIQNESKQTTESMSIAIKDVSNATSLVKSLGEFLVLIIQDVQKMNDEMNQIAAAVEEQSTAASQITSSISRNAQLSDDIKDHANEIIREVDELIKVSGELNQSISNFKIKNI